MKRSEEAERLTRAEKDALRAEMHQMVNEANVLRGEASKKMSNIPKGYELSTERDDVKFFLGMLLCAGLGFLFLKVFMWSVNGDDTVHLIVATVCTVALCVGLMSASAMKRRPYHTEEHVEAFYVNNLWYDKLKAELNRLKTGIEDYDRQYAEQEEYIEKFREYTYEIAELLGQSGGLTIVTKAHDFHAMLKLEAGEEKVSLRLGFNEADYNQMKALVKQFRQKLYGKCNDRGQDLTSECADCAN